MSIELTMSLQTSSAEKMEEFVEHVVEIAQVSEMDIRFGKDVVLLQACPEGLISLHTQGNTATIASDCSVGGPGYFVRVLSFYEDITEDEDIEFHILESYPYFENQDFTELKYQTFYEELRLYREAMKGYGAYALWNDEDYMPIMRPGYVITPLGYHDMKDFLGVDIEDLAENFFIWNNLEQDALYYKNCALSLLWKKCYFTYSYMNDQSEKAMKAIVDYIELAFEHDQTIPLPVASYHFLKEMLKEEDTLSSSMIPMNEDGIGYLRSDVTIDFRSWKIQMDGRCDRFVTYTNDMPTLRISAPYHHEDEDWSYLWMVSEEELDVVGNVEGFPSNKEVMKKQEEYIHIQAKVSEEESVIYLDIYVKDEQDIERQYERIRSIAKVSNLQA